MEKLNKLLDKYIEEKDFGDNLNEYNEAEIIDEETLEVNGNCHDIEYLYTKKFGFIKWLVDNDKIDLDKVEKKFYNEICITDYGDKDRIMGDDDLVIAVLSVQDNPIEFLISILK